MYQGIKHMPKYTKGSISYCMSWKASISKLIWIK